MLRSSHQIVLAHPFEDGFFLEGALEYLQPLGDVAARPGGNIANLEHQCRNPDPKEQEYDFSD
jgi:hypothetical protein